LIFGQNFGAWVIFRNTTHKSRGFTMFTYRFHGLLWLTVALLIPAADARPPMPLGHHGGLVTQCTEPSFFEETPAKEAQVTTLEKFSFTASDNTEPDYLEAWVNLQPVALTITPQRSGRLTVEGKLAAPITEGRAWIKVIGYSRDGCELIHTWNVYAGH
jgi:hypothetical protein